VVLGIVSAWFQQKEAIARLLARLGFRTIHPIPMARDWHFSQSKPYWALVTLKDGSQVRGLYGQRSFAGSDPQHRDLYLEALFHPVGTGDWAPVEDTAGILIMSDQIGLIEFRKIAEETYE